MPSRTKKRLANKRHEHQEEGEEDEKNREEEGEAAAAGQRSSMLVRSKMFAIMTFIVGGVLRVIWGHL